MARLTRAQTQERNRDKILTAARQEFGEHGFAEAKVDRIAERAELTRGAVYSNFPGKRALYFAALADLAARQQATLPAAEAEVTVRHALASIARVWAGRLSLPETDGELPAVLGRDLMPQILAEEATRLALAQLSHVEAVVLGLCLENLRSPRRRAVRMVRTARLVLTTLHGASRLADLAPDMVDPFDLISGCEKLAELDLTDAWTPLPSPPTLSPASHRWQPPQGVDLLRGKTVDLAADGVVVFLGTQRLGRLEDAVRVADGEPVTVVAVTGNPAELNAVVRLSVSGFASMLRQVIPETSWPALSIVCDDNGELTGAAQVPVGNTTETAVRVGNGRIVSRAEGTGAGYAVAGVRTKARV